MNRPRFIESIGVNDRIKDPPMPDNATNLEDMARLEGRTIGSLGERSWPWAIIILIWLCFGCPLLVLTIVRFWNATNLEQIAIACAILIICSLLHLPIVRAVVIKLKNRHTQTM
jgi:hypothetical protein